MLVPKYLCRSFNFFPRSPAKVEFPVGLVEKLPNKTPTNSPLLTWKKSKEKTPTPVAVEYLRSLEVVVVFLNQKLCHTHDAVQ